MASPPQKQQAVQKKIFKQKGDKDTNMETYLIGVILGAGTFTGFLLTALCWKFVEYLINEAPFYIHRIKEWWK